MSDREQEQIDQSEFQPGSNEQAQEQSDSVDQNQLQSGASLESEANDLSQENIIDDNSGPGGRSLRSNRGDPTEAVSAFGNQIELFSISSNHSSSHSQDKQIDADIQDAENADA